jgi:hypothetical protein
MKHNAKLVATVGAGIALAVTAATLAGGQQDSLAAKGEGVWLTRPLKLHPSEWRPPAYAADDPELIERLRQAYEAEYALSLKPGLFFPTPPGTEPAPLGMLSEGVVLKDEAGPE